MKKMAAGETASTGGGGTGTTTVSEFRAKVAHMKNWKPASTPSVSKHSTKLLALWPADDYDDDDDNNDEYVQWCDSTVQFGLI